MMTICFKKGLKVEPKALDKIISSTGNDIKQTVNHLSIYSASKETKLPADKAKSDATVARKDVKIVS